MKICVCSDSHGNSYGIAKMLRDERPDGLIFLGDGWGDVGRADVKPDAIYAAVAGNCDIGCGEPLERMLELFNRKILVTHGHRQRVKQGLETLAKYAFQRGASVALYGHTHRADARELGGVLLLNPGSIQEREERFLVLSGENGSFSFAHKSLKW